MSAFIAGSSGGTPDQLRRAKIVATLGPVSNNEATFRQLVRAGLDVARLNFSHGTHQEKLKLIEMVREVAREGEKPICILGDLQGPKIRTGKLENRMPVQLVAGQNLTITPREVAGTASLIGTTFPTLAENLEPGSRILLVRRTDRTARAADSRRRRRVRHHQWRAAGREQRHQSAGNRGSRAVADREGRRRPGVRDTATASMPSRCRSCAPRKTCAT